VWVALGITATLIFTAWSLLAYRATRQAQIALLPGQDGVSVIGSDDYWTFIKDANDTHAAEPAASRHTVGLVFFSGALVDPAAYAPLLRAVAAQGYTVLLVALPRRGAFGGADGDEVLERARAAMRARPGVARWVVSGHSRGGAVAARFVHQTAPAAAGLVLVGTSHPRDLDLSRLTIPVAKVLGTRDGVAELDKSYANRPRLPVSTRWVLIEGGNHSQFGYYGFQPGDWRATISREEQQRQTLAAIIEVLESADSATPVTSGRPATPGGAVDDSLRRRAQNIRGLLAELDGHLRISDPVNWSHEAAAALRILGQIRFEIAELRRAGLRVEPLESWLHELEGHLHGANHDTWSPNANAAQQTIGNLRLELQSFVRSR
jgi:pimeloyl-ACP methyl ester carboxylesterase